MKNNRAIEIMMVVALLLVCALMLLPVSSSDAQTFITSLAASPALPADKITLALSKKIGTAEHVIGCGNVFQAPATFKATESGIYTAEYADGLHISYRIITHNGKLVLDGVKCSAGPSYW